MNTIDGYFVKNYNDAIAINDNIIAGKTYRFSILTERLIRIEYNPKGEFIDSPSERIIFRKFPKTQFKISHTDTLMQITTSYFTLNYVKEKPITKSKVPGGGNLQIKLNDSDKTWYYGHPEARNFGGIIYSLDDFKGTLKLDKGMYSTDGFCCLNDADTNLINESGKSINRNELSIDLYVFMYKKDLGLCLQDYYKLTGYPMLIPRYALGNWWYKNHNYSINEIVSLVTNFKENKVPLSGILLSDKCCCENDNLNLNSLRGDDLRNISNHSGVKFSLEYNPTKTIKPDTITIQTLKNNIQINEGDFSILPLDNTKENILLSYGINNFLSNGIDNFYIDYNNIKDKKTLFKLVQSFYAASNSSTNKRTFIMSRNHNIAPHRNTVIYIGSTHVDWTTLEVLPRYFSTASNNGISFIGFPVGGFYGGVEKFELYIRYIQLGVFSPIMMLASDEGKYYRREPWRWAQNEMEVIRKYLNLRNKLVPYLYTESYKYHKSGSPIIQPLYYKYPKIYDEPLYKNQYFFGSNMLVCPITKKKNIVMNRVVQRLFIPEGIWYEFESGKKYIGNKYYMSFYKDEDYPIFCKEGSIIPMSLDSNTNSPVNMEINIFPGNNGEYQLYEDDGISNNYINANNAITEYTFNYELNNYYFKMKCIKNQGAPLPDSRNYRIVFKNTKMANVTILNNGNQIAGNVYTEKNSLIIELNNINTYSEIVINCNSEGVLLNSMTKLINDDIKGILEDLEIETTIKDKIDEVLFGELPIKKKRIAIRKLKKYKLEPKFIKMFLNLLEYIETV